MQRRTTLKAISAAAAASSVGALGASAAIANPNAPIRIGVLHSLSGTMAISETVLKDTVLMAVDEINGRGGVLGRRLEAVVVDPASNWPLFAERARQLLTRDRVAAVFGCWTSVSRKAVLPVFEELNGLLYYPVQYEGEEMSPNVLKPGGTLSSLGVYSEDLKIPLSAFAAGLGDHRIVTALCPGGKERMRRLMNVVASGRLDLGLLVTHHYRLDDIVAAYDLFANQRDGVLKVAIKP